MYPWFLFFIALLFFSLNFFFQSQLTLLFYVSFRCTAFVVRHFYNLWSNPLSSPDYLWNTLKCWLFLGGCLPSYKFPNYMLKLMFLLLPPSSHTYVHTFSPNVCIIQFLVKSVMVSRIMCAPTPVCLILRTCEYIPLHGKRKLKLHIELRLLISWF